MAEISQLPWAWAAPIVTYLIFCAGVMVGFAVLREVTR